MAISLSVNGVGYSFPQQGDKGYAGQVTAWAQALTNGCLQLGGSYTLLSDLNLSAFGILAPYFTSKTANPAATGILRLAKTDAIKWRNNANGADLPLDITSLDLLEFNGTQLTGQPGLNAFQTTSQTGITTATTVKFDNVITDTDSAYNTSTGNYTVPTGKGGWYAVDCTVRLNQITTAGTQQISLTLGALALATIADGTIAAGTGHTHNLSFKALLTAGQTIFAQAQTSAGTCNTAASSFCNLSIKRLV